MLGDQMAGGRPQGPERGCVLRSGISRSNPGRTTAFEYSMALRSHDSLFRLPLRPLRPLRAAFLARGSHRSAMVAVRKDRFLGVDILPSFATFSALLRNKHIIYAEYEVSRTPHAQ